MKRFVFRLERILKLRRQIEERKEKEFAFKNAEYLKIKEEIDNNVSKLKSFIRDSKLDSGYFTAQDIIAIDSYIIRMEKKIEELNRILEDKLSELNRAREELNKARKDRKVIEVLKDRAYQRYAEMVQRVESIELDDIVQKLHLNKEKLTIQNVPLEEM